MSDKPKLYIAGTGMVTPVGANTEMTTASVEAQINAYAVSGYSTQAGEPITMAKVPDQIFADFEGEIDEGDRFNPRHDRVTKMAILAINEACAQQESEQAVPLVLAMSDVTTDDEGLSSLIENLANNTKPWVSPELSRSFYSGRASGIEAIDFAFKYLGDTQYPYYLIGGSDSYEDDSRLLPLESMERLRTENSSDAFVPGEAACFLLLTPNINLARQHNGHVIAILQPGLAEERGHLFSNEPYRGDGLDQAFKTSLINQSEQSIHSIYSCMNGENHWSKEYGVALLRNDKAFKDPVCVEHPADCYGDIGSATATTLIALAAENLFKNELAQAHLVYSSSDTAKRGAIVVKKIALATMAEQETNNQHVRDL
ncbi:MAG: hypothetical protein OEZ15_11670 [Gammaproteobacteria bacterium]|nr:hypothetical protein [Gammaproteobacteria bacterium]